MTEPPSNEAMPQSSRIEVASKAGPSSTVWERLRHHKVLEWTLAYGAAGYTALHLTEMLTESFGWPHLVLRIVALVLLLGAPIVVLLAWYHGYRAQHRFSTAELSILTVLLMIAGTVLWGFTRGPGAGTSAESPRATAASAAKEPLPGTQRAPTASVAVMPFVNLTGDPGKEYFSDGMAEELIDALAQVPGLQVPARTSSFAYKGRNVDIRRIGHDLGVARILEGSVRSAGDRIRVTAQLVDSQSGYHLWSRTYDRQFKDIFKLQDDLAAAIVSALQGTAENELSTPHPQSTRDVEAYRLYLQATTVQRGSEQSFRESLALFDRAIERDPHFARAFARRAQVRTAFLTLGYPLPNALIDAERDANRALELDPHLPDALQVIGAVNAFRGNWLQSEASFRKALLLGPNDPLRRAIYAAYVLETSGRLQEALSQNRETYRLAPADPRGVGLLAAINSLMGRDAEAVPLADLAVELGGSATITPLCEVYANAATRAKQYTKAATLIGRCVTVSVHGGDTIAAVSAFYSALSNRAKTRQAVTALQELARHLDPRAIDINLRKNLIGYFTQLGALDEAYALANQTLDQIARSSGTIGSAWGVLWLPEMRPFRRDPRFQAFAARLKLFDYWRRYGAPDECDLNGEKLVCR